MIAAVILFILMAVVLLIVGYQIMKRLDNYFGGKRKKDFRMSIERDKRE